jgi:DNA-binding NtrC family response regulator
MAETTDIGRVLVIDDEQALLDTITRLLEGRGHRALAASSAEQGFAIVEAQPVDVVITDLQLGGEIDGIEICRQLAHRFPGLPVIVVTAFGSVEVAVEAMRAGAYDFLSKPIDIDVTVMTVERALGHQRLAQEVRRLRRRVEVAKGFGDLIGASPPMQVVFDLLGRAAESDATVLISGESGTGKELVARALHREGRRRGGPFVAINCAAMPETLLESELFGHAKGAFTDARKERMGLFVKANGGTLFLDEVGEMPLAMQVKLLRALQERTVRPVGSEVDRPFDVRVVCATNRDLEHEVDEGRFRGDLFYRLNVIHIEVPPLRDRGAQDILALADHFLRRACSDTGKDVADISSGAAEQMLGYGWPGNVRELQNCIERAVALTREDRINVDDLPAKLREQPHQAIMPSIDEPMDFVPLEEVERRYVARVLHAAGGNRTAAARILGLDRKTLRRKLTRWGIKD